MIRLLPFLLVAGCASAPLVTAAGVLPRPVYAVVGDGAAAGEVLRQLAARGWYAADAPTIIHPGFAAAPRRIGTCAEARAEGCAQWLDEPETGWDPFAAPLRFRLTLAFEGTETARLTMTRDGDAGDAPLAEMVSAALDRLAAAP